MVGSVTLISICTLLAVKLPQQSSRFYSQFVAEKQSHGLSGPLCSLRVPGFGPLCYYYLEEETKKEVPHSLYPPPYSARADKAHPLLICDLVFEEEMG